MRRKTALVGLVACYAASPFESREGCEEEMTAEET
jgi:hypothetical protein